MKNAGINIKRHKELIKKFGEWVDHYPGQLCTCVLKHGGLEHNLSPSKADPNCKACFGMGIFWLNPTRIRGLVLGMHSDSNGRFWLQNGIALPEDMMFSTFVELNDFDLIVPLKDTGFPFQGELMQRGVKDTLSFRPAGGKIDLCSVANELTGGITSYIQDTDYTVSGKEVVWPAGRGPSQGTVYSVRYRAIFEFIVFNPLAQRFEDGRDLGQRALLRKRHLAWPSKVNS